MSWVRIDDQLHSHPKIADAGNEAIGVWIRMLAWSAAHLTDGVVPTSIAKMFALGDIRIIERLVSVGLLEREKPSELVIHDYLDWNPTGDDVRAERERTLLRVKRHRKKKRQTRNADVTPLQGRYKRDCNGGVTGAPSPSPSPNERDSKSGDGNGWESGSFQDPPELHQLEQIGFKKFGQLGGAGQAAISGLMPIFLHEIDAAMKTKGRSWTYAARVVESYREENDRGPAKPGSPNPPPSKSAFARATKKLLEMDPDGTGNHPDDPLFGVRAADDAIAGLLSDPCD